MKNEEEKRVDKGVDKGHVDCNLTIFTFNFVLIFVLKFSEQPKKKNIDKGVDKCHVDRNLTILTLNFGFNCFLEIVKF